MPELRAKRFESDEAWLDRPAVISKDDMTATLLSMPCHKETIIPSLLKFFNTPDRRKHLKPFLQTFAGGMLQVPTPKQLSDYERDEAVVMALKSPNPDPCSQIRICLEHSITYRHLQEVHKAVFHRELHAPPTNGTKVGRLDAAGALMREFKGADGILCEMFGLNSKDLQQIRAARK